MILACMYAEDRTAWECDIVESYGILDYERIPVRKLAALSAGLRSDARIVMKLSGCKVTPRETLLAIIADRLTWLCWTKTEDGQKGRNKPVSILETLIGADRKKDSGEYMTFDTGKEFQEERNRILSGMKGE